MRRFSPVASRCEVFTFKEGLLSPVAHDLLLAVTQFQVRFESGAVTATFDPSSLRVHSAMRDGHPATTALSPHDRSEIESRIRSDVLEASRHPEIRFRGTVDEAASRVSGTLTLHGRERPLSFPYTTAEHGFTCEVTLHQPDYGIKPYSALLGTLRIRADVKILLTLWE